MEAYLDNSATTKPCEAAVEAALRAMQTEWYNPSALYKPALDAQKHIEAARNRCLAAAGAAGERLVFTGGGTEADNLALLGYLRTVHKPGRVLILQVEHPAVLACAQEIGRMGHRVETLPVDRDGVCDLEKANGMLNADVRMICLMQVNNETGAIQPIREIASLRNSKCPDAALHVDGVQGYLRVPLDFRRLGIQSYAFSGHKIHACKGIGGLILRRDHKIVPVVFGGGQEAGIRSGTENVPGIMALDAAVASYDNASNERMAALRGRLWQGRKKASPAAEINGPGIDSERASPHILNVSLPPVRSQTMLFALEADGVYVSAGSACASHKQKTSPVLSAMGVGAQRADSALRFSLSPETTADMIDWAVSCCAKQYALLSRYVRR